MIDSSRLDYFSVSHRSLPIELGNSLRGLVLQESRVLRLSARSLVFLLIFKPPDTNSHGIVSFFKTVLSKSRIGAPRSRNPFCSTSPAES